MRDLALEALAVPALLEEARVARAGARVVYSGRFLEPLARAYFFEDGAPAVDERASREVLHEEAVRALAQGVLQLGVCVDLSQFVEQVARVDRDVVHAVAQEVVVPLLRLVPGERKTHTQTTAAHKVAGFSGFSRKKPDSRARARSRRRRPLALCKNWRKTHTHNARYGRASR